MILKKVIVSSYVTNCYIFGDEESKKIIVIDPGDNADKIIDAIDETKCELVGILITHGHEDHNGALDTIALHYNVSEIKEDVISVGKYTLKRIKTPGHKDDAVCFFEEGEKLLFSGDTLFKGTVGRWDFPTGNFDELKESVLKLYELPEETLVYPGHGFRTTIGKEKVSNQIIRAL